MRLFLIRHGHAIDLDDDDLRPLSVSGRRQSVSLGQALAQRADFHPPEIWHSPLVRAVETAELLVQGLGRAIPLREIDGIRPEDDPAEILETLNGARQDLALVGHNPFMGDLGGLLATGRGHSLMFDKACGYAFERQPEGGKWRLLGPVQPLVS